MAQQTATADRRFCWLCLPAALTVLLTCGALFLPPSGAASSLFDQNDATSDLLRSFEEDDDDDQELRCAITASRRSFRRRLREISSTAPARSLAAGPSMLRCPDTACLAVAYPPPLSLHEAVIPLRC